MNRDEHINNQIPCRHSMDEHGLNWGRLPDLEPIAEERNAPKNRHVYQR